MDIRWLGTMEYGEALRLLEDLQEARIRNEVPDTLLLLEHPPVLTMGRRANEANIRLPRETLRAMGVSVVDVNRGGDVTYHGPGQLVGYPIFDLRAQGRDIRLFLTRLESIFLTLLDRYGVAAHAESGVHTGIFAGTDKLVAIGISVRQWVTLHGFAFNVSTNLSHFDWIIPCGLSDRGVTSLCALTGQPVSLESIADEVAALFRETFESDGTRGVDAQPMLPIATEVCAG